MIKFRAWHKKKQKYMEVKSIDFEKETITLMEVSNVIRYTMVDFNEVILEQYTGVPDENGKDLYVGDIAIEFGEYLLIEDIKDVSNEDIESQFVIVGNIHENKELLE